MSAVFLCGVTSIVSTLNKIFKKAKPDIKLDPVPWKLMIFITLWKVLLPNIILRFRSAIKISG